MRTLIYLLLIPMLACTNSKAQDKMAAPAKAKMDKKEQVAQGLQVGDLAPDFNLKNIDGSMVSLESLEGAKGYVVIFTCNHCPYAVMYEDRMIDLHNHYAPLGYPIVAIMPNDPEVKPDDSFENMKKRSMEKGFPFVYLYDDGQKVYPQYGATKTPHVYLLDKDRMVKYIGAIDDNARDAEDVTVPFLENAIEALLAGKNPDPVLTKAIGCSIKTKA